MIRIRHLGHYLSAAALFVVFGLMALDLTLELVQGSSFAIAEGVVTGSRWHTSWSSVGKGYFVDISYAYSVDGRTCRLDRYFGKWNRAVGKRPRRESWHRVP